MAPESKVGHSLPERLEDNGPFRGQLLDLQLIDELVAEMRLGPAVPARLVLFADEEPAEALVKHRELIEEAKIAIDLRSQRIVLTEYYRRHSEAKEATAAPIAAVNNTANPRIHSTDASRSQSTAASPMWGPMTTEHSDDSSSDTDGGVPVEPLPVLPSKRRTASLRSGSDGEISNQNRLQDETAARQTLPQLHQGGVYQGLQMQLGNVQTTVPELQSYGASGQNLTGLQDNTEPLQEQLRPRPGTGPLPSSNDCDNVVGNQYDLNTNKETNHIMPAAEVSEDMETDGQAQSGW